MEYRIDNTFEVPSQEEWDENLVSEYFIGMRIDVAGFKVAQDLISQFFFKENICNHVRQHNNKVGTLAVTYVLCRHYFDKGIPDDPWYISPGKNGETVQYMPNFKPEDWLTRYWFSYFSEVMYLKIFSIWDSIMSLINDYYQMAHEQDLGFRKRVMNSLKSQRQDIYDLLLEVWQMDDYKEANRYRTQMVHGFTPMDVSSGITIMRNVETEIFGGIKDGKIVRKKVNSPLQISLGIGDYTTSETIMKNIDKVCKLTGEKITEIIALLQMDEFGARLE